MKKILFGFVLCLVAIFSFAQSYRDKGKLSFGAEAGIPLGDANQTHTYAIGATFKYAYRFEKNVAVTLQSGYVSFIGQSFWPVGKYADLGQIPVKAGLQVYFNKFYVEPQIGISFLNANGTTTNAFTYAGGIGTVAIKNVDIGLRYEAMSNNGTFGFAGLRVAYIFPHRKGFN